MSNDDSMWWNPKRTRSYGCLFNFIIGNRGGGKTFNALTDCISRYLKTRNGERPSQFLYVRRMKEELKKITTNHNGRLFNDITRKQIFHDHQLSAEANVLYVDKEVMGYSIPLSTATILKSDPMPLVDTIIFDEFIIDNKGVYHYLQDEVTKFLELYETIARPGTDPNRPPTVVFFLSNAVTIANPYFYYFQLTPPVNGDIQRFGRSKDILVQNVVNAQLVEKKKSSRFGQMLEGSRYAAYAYDNEWLLDDNAFIEKKTQRAVYYMSLRYMERWLGIWWDSLQMVFYVSLNYNPEFPVRYSATTDDHQPNTMLFKRGSGNTYIRHLLDAYQAGAVRYESIKIKSWFREIVGMGYR